MERMLVVVFDSESAAYKGKQALQDLSNEGILSVYASAVLARSADGKTTVKHQDDLGPVGSLIGTSLGSLIGVLGGPIGLAIGASTGLALGAGVDLDHLRIGDDFIDDVRKQLLPNRVALMAEVDEEWTTPVDTRMEPLGGTVFRRALSEVRHDANQGEIDAMKADMAQLKAEHAQARADRKGKLTEKINHLSDKIQAQLQRNKERREAAERTAKAKAEVLRAKAATARAKV